MPKSGVFVENQPERGYLSEKQYRVKVRETRALVGALIRRFRNLRKLRQRHVARLMGVNQNTPGRYERGDDWADLVRLHQLSKALEIPLLALIPDELLSPDEQHVVRLLRGAIRNGEKLRK